MLNHRSPALSPVSQAGPLSPPLQPPVSVAPAAPPAILPEPQGQVHKGLLANPEPDEDWSSILHNIPEIGISRFLYLLKKYPSIILIIIGAWILWGRGFDAELHKVETNMGITGVVSGIITAAGVVFISQHHSNDKDAAKTQVKISLDQYE